MEPPAAPPRPRHWRGALLAAAFLAGLLSALSAHEGVGTPLRPGGLSTGASSHDGGAVTVDFAALPRRATSSSAARPPRSAASSRPPRSTASSRPPRSASSPSAARPPHSPPASRTRRPTHAAANPPSPAAIPPHPGCPGCEFRASAATGYTLCDALRRLRAADPLNGSDLDPAMAARPHYLLLHSAAEGISKWHRTVTEVLHLAQRLGRVFVEPCVRAGRIVPCAPGLVTSVASGHADAAQHRREVEALQRQDQQQWQQQPQQQQQQQQQQGQQGLYHKRNDEELLNVGAFSEECSGAPDLEASHHRAFPLRLYLDMVALRARYRNIISFNEFTLRAVCGKAHASPEEVVHARAPPRAPIVSMRAQFPLAVCAAPTSKWAAASCGVDGAFVTFRDTLNWGHPTFVATRESALDHADATGDGDAFKDATGKRDRDAHRGCLNRAGGRFEHAVEWLRKRSSSVIGLTGVWAGSFRSASGRCDDPMPPFNRLHEVAVRHWLARVAPAQGGRGLLPPYLAFQWRAETVPLYGLTACAANMSRAVTAVRVAVAEALAVHGGVGELSAVLISDLRSKNNRCNSWSYSKYESSVPVRVGAQALQVVLAAPSVRNASRMRKYDEDFAGLDSGVLSIRDMVLGRDALVYATAVLDDEDAAFGVHSSDSPAAVAICRRCVYCPSGFARAVVGLRRMSSSLDSIFTVTRLFQVHPLGLATAVHEAFAQAQQAQAHVDTEDVRAVLAAWRPAKKSPAESKAQWSEAFDHLPHAHALAHFMRQCPQGQLISCMQRTLDCWSNGSWVRTRRSRHPANTVPPPSTWNWVPHPGCTSVQMPRLNAQGWCGVHSGVRLLLVGDSITAQVYAATVKSAKRAGFKLHAVAVHDLCDSRKDLAPFQEGCSAVRIRECHATIAYVRNDIADFNTTGREWQPFPQNFMMHPIGGVVSAIKPTHVLINRGAHFTEDAAFEAGLRSALSSARALLPSAHIMLRNTPSGHANCSAYSAPLSSLPPGWGQHAPFRWPEFPRQNALMRAVARQRADPALYLDFATPTQYRPDRHKSARDCLHYDVRSFDAVPYFWARLTAAAVWLTLVV